jgi:hypothetical protein
LGFERMERLRALFSFLSWDKPEAVIRRLARAEKSRSRTLPIAHGLRR